MSKWSVRRSSNQCDKETIKEGRNIGMKELTESVLKWTINSMIASKSIKELPHDHQSINSIKCNFFETILSLNQVNGNIY